MTSDNYETQMAALSSADASIKVNAEASKSDRNQSQLQKLNSAKEATAQPGKWL